MGAPSNILHIPQSWKHMHKCNSTLLKPGVHIGVNDLGTTANVEEEQGEQENQ